MADLAIISIWLWIEIIASLIIIVGYVLWNIPSVILALRRIYRQYYVRVPTGERGKEGE
jgi:hypothetical protein